MMRRVPSLERIKKMIAWEPKTSLTDALRTIIEERILGDGSRKAGSQTKG